MTKKLTWYEQGFQDGLEGFADPPMHPSHGSYKNYMEGNRDGERQAALDNADGMPSSPPVPSRSAPT